MLEDASRGEIGERGRVRPGLEAPHPVGHCERLAHQPIEQGTAGSGGSGGLPGGAQLCGDLALAGLSGVEATGQQQHVLQGRLTGPGPQQPRGLSRLRPPSAQLLQRGPAEVARGLAVRGGKKELDAVASTEVEKLGDPQRLTQRAQAGLEIGLGDGKTRDLVDAGMPV